ncbi:MAG TPA: amidohydrolase family protein [Planctomycetota bacterium]|nr:amidohydrolase family protein [Planctomycetota bacterium]
MTQTDLTRSSLRSLRTLRNGLLAAAVLGVGAGIAPMSAEVLVIRGGTVHTPSGASVATVLVRDGAIAEIGPQVAAPAGAKVLDASGLHVYPGLFDAFSRLGLTEIDSVGATVDVAEMGDYNPHLVAATAIHPASEVIPVTRASGITHAVVAPGSSGGGGFFGGGGGSVIPGQASVVSLDGWTVEEMAIEAQAALVLTWPTLRTRTFDLATFSVRNRPFAEVEKEYEEQLDSLRDWLEAARHYDQATARGDASKFDRNWELEALVPYVRGERVVMAVANSARQIRDAVALAEDEGLKLVLAGGDEAWREKELLAEKGVPVILGPTQRLPGEEDEPYDQPFTAPQELHEAGVKIAFASFDAARSRRLPTYAAIAAGYGLPRDQALASVTRNAAEMLGIGDRVGTIEPGKIANLIVTDGDPLEIRTQVRHLVIEGREVSTDNKHRRSWEMWSSRPTAAP